MLPRDHFVSRFLYSTTAGVKCYVAAVKHCPVLHFSVHCLLITPLLSVENWVPLAPVLGGMRDVALIHYPSYTDSINPSLQFSSNFVVIHAAEGLHFVSRIFFLYLIRTFAKITDNNGIDKYRIPKESPTRQNWKCGRLGLIEPVHGRQTVALPSNSSTYCFDYWHNH
jgi:hypothetical protein